ncbi:putative ribonuclease H-like domain-containing protein [Tanacetum coccineum]|uniref:Ribonuclease H-like domain-containing protein n=1 Tax=Tanacetum coccineum TaxID=301880 RepID=A0ABQ5J1U9_9ASTR
MSVAHHWHIVTGVSINALVQSISSVVVVCHHAFEFESSIATIFSLRPFDLFPETQFGSRSGNLLRRLAESILLGYCAGSASHFVSKSAIDFACLSRLIQVVPNHGSHATCLYTGWKGGFLENFKFAASMVHRNVKFLVLTCEGDAGSVCGLVSIRIHECAVTEMVGRDRTVREPLELLHMDLFGPVSVESINKKKYCLVVTDDCSKFSWVFFLAYKDETYDMLHDLIVGLENMLRHKVKTIRNKLNTAGKVNVVRHNLLLLVKVNAVRHKLTTAGDEITMKVDGLCQIVGFSLSAHTIKYALTINPTIYTLCIEQFWAIVKAKTINGEVQLQGPQWMEDGSSLLNRRLCHKEMDDSLVRAATTATSLDAEQDRGARNMGDIMLRLGLENVL